MKGRHKLQGEIAEVRASLDRGTCIFPYKRLMAVQTLMLKNGGKFAGLQPTDLLNPEMVGNLDQWKRLQRELEFITDDIQGYGDDLNDLDQNTLIQPSQPSPEMWGFAGEGFRAMSCDCHSQFLRGSRLRIGTYHAVSKHVPKSLCVLLEQLEDTEQWGIWHELLIRDHLRLK